MVVRKAARSEGLQGKGGRSEQQDSFMHIYLLNYVFSLKCILLKYT